jgi:hypothetical protein
MARTFEPLARRLCKAVHDLTDAPPDDWVPLKRAALEINVTNQELIDGAVAEAVQKGWLKVSGKPVPTHLLLTAAGQAVAIKKK